MPLLLFSGKPDGVFLLVVGFITYKMLDQLNQKGNKASPSYCEGFPYAWKHYKSPFKLLE